jgi:hypothetical protein
VCEGITHIFTVICKIVIKYTLTEKVQLIHENEENASYHTLAEKYKISIGSLSNIFIDINTFWLLFCLKLNRYLIVQINTIFFFFDT